MTYKQYDLTASLQRFLINETGIQTDLVFDGYEYSPTRPLITIEQMQNNLEYNVKGREAVEVIYRWQIGLHASNAVERMKEQERINDLLTFSNIPYFDFEKSADNPAGFFSVEVNAITPMPSDDITNHSTRHTVYFDIELLSIKRRG